MPPLGTWLIDRLEPAIGDPIAFPGTNESTKASLGGRWIALELALLEYHR